MRALIFLRKLDWIMVASATGLTIFGLVNLSTLAATESGYLLLFWKQLGFVAAGFGRMALIAFLD